ncbi:EamA family transporter [Fictibacillus aquaticus]|uniref:EamA family transporter n=2 Tax=Fictibacillus aquaticus TaxID=2021314 RepID=A0A235FBF9_9BACL|nr:EamA family transporter [Fictibacillus aquaticus]
MQKTSSPIPVVFPLVVGIVAVSFSSIFIKWSDAPVSVQGMYRLLFTLLLMTPFLFKHFRSMVKITFRQYGYLFLSGVFLALHFLFWMGSLKLTTVASSTILLSLQPVFVMAGAYFLFKEKTELQSVYGMIIAIIGAVMIGWGDIGVSKENLLGDALSVLGTVVVAIHMLLGQKLMRDIPSFLYSYIVFISASAVFALYNLAAGIPMTGYSENDWKIFILLAVIPTVFGHVLFNWLLKYISATAISIAILGEPVGASILAYILLSEHLQWFQWIGGALVLAGLYYVLYRKPAIEESSNKQTA